MQCKILFVVLFLINTIFLFSQKEIVEEANRFIVMQRYASAYELLRQSDPNNENPDVVIAKTNLLLNFYVKTNKFQAFALKDIAPNQNLQDFRDNNSSVKLFPFQADSILNKLANQYPNNYKLLYALGNFYYEVHLEHTENDDWILPDSVVVQKIQTNYMAAYDKGEFDFWSLFGIGYTYLIDDNYDEAIRFFEKSLKLNQDYSLTHYNLAYAHLKLKQPQKALLYAENAFIIQVIPSFKSETAVLLSTIHLELKNEEKALFFLREANKLTPKNYNVLLPLVELEVAMDVGDAIWDTNELFNLAPRNPIIYQDLLKIFSENEKEKDYAKFLESKKNDFKNDVLISANIFFYLAICQYEMNEWVSAKINFETARSKFRNIYPADHNVFKVINSYTEAIKKKKKV